MNDWVFPLVGPLLIVGLLLPLLALFVHGVFKLTRLEGFHHQGLTYFLLLGTVLFPLLYVLSTGLYQSENMSAVFSCLFPHAESLLCWEMGLFTLLFLGLLGLRLSQLYPRLKLQRASGEAAKELELRISRLIEQKPYEALIRGHVQVLEGDWAMATTGVFSKRLLIGRQFGEGLSDEMLEAALAHEASHMASRDGLWFMLLHLLLGLNPMVQKLFRPYVRRFKEAAELAADQGALAFGACPLALGEAILRASKARPMTIRPALSGDELGFLKKRIGLLLEEPEKKKGAQVSRLVFPLEGAFVLFGGLSLLSPYVLGTALFDWLHLASEHLVLALFRV